MHNSPASPEAHTVEGLAQLGVPKEYVDSQRLIAYVGDNEVGAEKLIAAIFPNDEQAAESTLEELFQESTDWLKWLMFKGDTRIALEELRQLNAGEQRV